LNSTGAAAGFFRGVMDEVRIWNYARSGPEILAGKDVEILSAAGLIGRWGLDEGSGTSASNSAESTITGTLVNGPTWVAGFQSPANPTVIRGPYLQSGTPTGMIVRWRTDVATASRVTVGTSASQLDVIVDDATLTTEHLVQLTGLQPDTQYFYGVGSPSATLVSGPDYTFFTAPPVGSSQPVRIWVLGDSGKPGPAATLVRDAYFNFNGNRYTDLCLMLGDNAYPEGTDAEYQSVITILRRAPIRHCLSRILRCSRCRQMLSRVGWPPERKSITRSTTQTCTLSAWIR
jgi:Purple acid Phosphatase, N-terminal domain